MVVFAATKMERFSVVMLNGEEGRVAVVWLAKVVVLLRLRCGRVGEERKVGFVQYMESKVPLDAAEKNLGCISMRWSIFDELDTVACGKEFKHRVLKVEEWYGLESVSSRMGSAHYLRPNLAVYPFTTDLPWFHQQFYVIRIHIDCTTQTDTEARDFVE